MTVFLHNDSYSTRSSVTVFEIVFSNSDYFACNTAQYPESLSIVWIKSNGGINFGNQEHTRGV